MKTKSKNTLLVITGIIIGLLVSSFIVFMYAGLNAFKSQVIDISSSKIRDKVSIRGIQIPEKAYNIDFYYTGFQDYTYWLAFSASDEEIRKVFPGANTKDKEEYRPNPNSYMPKDKNGNTLLDWWPEDTENFEIRSSKFGWMGYDKKNSRLYIYKFKT